MRLILGEPDTLAGIARQTLVHAQRDGNTVIITDTVLGETYFALRHHYEMPETEVLRALHALLQSGLVVPEPVSLIAAFVPEGGAGFMDRLINARHRAIGATTLTFDKKIARLSGAKLLSP